MKSANNSKFDPFEDYDEELDGLKNRDEELFIVDGEYFVKLDTGSYCIMADNGILTQVQQNVYNKIKDFYGVEPSKFGLSIFTEEEEEYEEIFD